MNRMVQRARDEESGFTLIELMIVIVILGVLAGIVIFAVGGITDNGNVAACKSDVKTVAVAVEAYKAKNGNFPPNLEPTLDHRPEQVPPAAGRSGRQHARQRVGRLHGHVHPGERATSTPAASAKPVGHKVVRGAGDAGPPNHVRNRSAHGQAGPTSAGLPPGGFAISLGDRLLATASS